MKLTLVLIVALVGFVFCEKESASHGAGHKPPSHIHQDHMKDGEHNEHYDHEAILGKVFNSIRLFH